MKQCVRCKQEKNIDDFLKQSRMADGFGSYCKECRKEKAAEWRAANPDMQKANDKKYREAKF